MGIQEIGTEEDTREVSVDFLGTELGFKDADGLEFQRVHQIEKVGPLQWKTQTDYCMFPEIP